MAKSSRAETLLEVYLEANKFEPQSKLPAERSLCHELGVTRTELRKALASLEVGGKIWRHVGRGTFMGTRPIGKMDELALLSKVTNPAEVMQARLLMEPGLARIAAIHATRENIERMKFCTMRKNKAEDLVTYEHWDWAFHEAIAEATHNTLLLTLFNALNTIREAVDWGQLRRLTLTPPRRTKSHDQHEVIIAAIASRDMDEAETAMRDHLTSVNKSLF